MPSFLRRDDEPAQYADYIAEHIEARRGNSRQPSGTGVNELALGS